MSRLYRFGGGGWPVLVLVLAICPAPARGADTRTGGVVTGGPGAGITTPVVSAGHSLEVLVGEWVGAKLLCRKEIASAVRCGKPNPFSVVFRDDGTGSSPDDKFPDNFTFRWKSESELIITPVPPGEEITLFQLELQKGFLNFQAYINLPLDEGEGGIEAKYIHYMFDVSRAR